MKRQDQIRQLITANPMTVRQIAEILDADPDGIAVVLRRMDEYGKAKRAGFGQRVNNSGSTPYLWVAT